MRRSFIYLGGERVQEGRLRAEVPREGKDVVHLRVRGPVRIAIDHGDPWHHRQGLIAQALVEMNQDALPG